MVNKIENTKVLEMYIEVTQEFEDAKRILVRQGIGKFIRPVELVCSQGHWPCSESMMKNMELREVGDWKTMEVRRLLD